MRKMFLPLLLFFFTLSFSIFGLTEGGKVKARKPLSKIHVSKTALSAYSNSDTLFLFEDFESGNLPGSPWRIIKTHEENPVFPGNWFVTPTDDSVAAGNGSFMAWVNYADDEIQDEWLITPVINFSGYEDLFLDFLRIYHIPSYSDSATLNIRVSKDNGKTFPDTIYSLKPSSLPGREEVSLSLFQYINEDSVRFGFQYVGKNGDSAGLDDIRIRAGTPHSVKKASWGQIKINYK